MLKNQNSSCSYTGNSYTIYFITPLANIHVCPAFLMYTMSNKIRFKLRRTEQSWSVLQFMGSKESQTSRFGFSPTDNSFDKVGGIQCCFKTSALTGRNFTPVRKVQILRLTLGEDVHYCWGHHQYCWGHHQYIGGFSIHWGDTISSTEGYHSLLWRIFSTVEGYHQYCGDNVSAVEGYHQYCGGDS